MHYIHSSPACRLAMTEKAECNSTTGHTNPIGKVSWRSLCRILTVIKAQLILNFIKHNIIYCCICNIDKMAQCMSMDISSKCIIKSRIWAQRLYGALLVTIRWLDYCSKDRNFIKYKQSLLSFVSTDCTYAVSNNNIRLKLIS